MLALDTPIPTPLGWTTMGALRVGDVVFDEAGAACQVVAVSAVDPVPDSYRITFDDGSALLACAAHEWLTFDAAELVALTRSDEAWRARRRSTRPSKAKGKKSERFTASLSARNAARRGALRPVPVGTVRTTAVIAASLLTPAGRRNHAVPVAGALQLPDAELPVDPYTLGAWLGDGTSANASLTCFDAGILTEIEAAGYRISSRAKAGNYGITGGLLARLRAIGVLGNKHVPAGYLRGSLAQRLALLQGLMDTDGHATSSGACEFDNTRRALIDAVHELVLSLGIKATVQAGVAKIGRRIIGPKWRIKFTTALPVFRLARKLARQNRIPRRTTRFRYVVACEPVDPVPMRCIAVSSASRLYLAGTAMVPTHNSDFLLGDFLQDVGRYADAWQGVLFRRTYRELEELLGRAHQIYPGSGAKWEASKDRWRWPNGAVLRLRSLERDADATRYQGHSYTWIGWDELTQWASPFAYRFLRGRLRSARGVPTKRIRATANPGGVGHQWVKAGFIDAAPGGYVPVCDPVTGMDRMFIPSRLRDNQVLLAADPGYEGRLRGLGSPELVRGMLEGDWNVVSGAYFPEFSTARHVVAPRALPAHWTRFRAMDWGSARPFAVLWIAVSDGTDAAFPPGALVVYREWYGMEPEQPNMGLRLPSELVAAGILEREAAGERVLYSVADPRMFGSDDGPSIAERMGRRGVVLTRADNTRVGDAGAMSGWDQLRARLRGEDGAAGLMVFSTCVHLIRTLPTLQHDAARPEDLDTNGEDHAADALRYGCMSRPFQAAPPSAAAAGDRWARAFAAGDDAETWRTA